MISSQHVAPNHITQMAMLCMSFGRKLNMPQKDITWCVSTTKKEPILYVKDFIS